VKVRLIFFHEEGYISKNPAVKLKEPKLEQQIPKFLSKLEIEHQHGWCHTPMVSWETR